MRGARLYQTLHLFMMLDPYKRSKFYKDNNIFKSMGEHCLIMDRKVPLYARLISLGDNVQIASGVSFITHDITHLMLNNMKKLSTNGGQTYNEMLGCIEIGNNVFIGTGTKILFNTKIESNVIIGAGSIVTHDIPDNSVVGGTPAKVIESMEEYLSKRDKKEMYPAEMSSVNESINDELEDWCWERHKIEHRNIG